MATTARWVIATLLPQSIPQCSTDTNCAVVWDDTSGLPYILSGTPANGETE